MPCDWYNSYIYTELRFACLLQAAFTWCGTSSIQGCSCRYPYERDLLRYLEQLIRDMDVKIRKNKERAEAESRPKVLKPDDQRRLDDIKARQAGISHMAARLCLLWVNMFFRQ